MKNVFEKEVSQELIARIKKLNASTTPQWGKMNVGQMLAHCCITYEMEYTDKHKRPNGFVVFMLRLLVKPSVCGERKYPKNGKATPQFIIHGNRDFNKERKRLIAFVSRTQKLGEAHFNNKKSHSFGQLTVREWSNMFYKHLDHHLTQFGV